MDKTSNKEKVASQNWSRYVRARDAGHEDYIEFAQKCNNFYMGEQWTQEDLDALAETGRPALTVNQILPTINTILGEQSNKRADIRYLPKGDADQQTAEVLTKLGIQIQDNNNFDYTESQVFADGIIEERGYYDIRMDFSDNVQGDVSIKSVDPRTVILDPDAREYNPDTWSEVTVSKWMTLNEIELTYGKAKAKEIQAKAITANSNGMDSIQYIEEENFGDVDPTEEDDDAAYDKSGRKIGKIRVIDRQYKLIKKTRMFVDLATGEKRPVPVKWEEDMVQRVKAAGNLQITSKFEESIKWTVTADTVVLHDDWSPYNFFTIVPYFPYFRRGKPFGVVRNLISPQEQYNKVKSQELHIVNSTANSGYTVEQGSLTNMTTDGLAEDGAKTGLVIEHAPGTEAPKKIQANQIPTGLDRIGMKAAEDIKSISGISDAMLGTESSETSGRALENKLSRGMIQVQVPFDNLNRTRTILARRILSLIKDYYTDQRIITIVDPVAPERQQQMAINQPDPVTGQIRNNVALGEYAITVSSVPSRATYNDTQFVEALSLRNAGIALPDWVAVQYSTLENKAELVEMIKKMTGMAQPTPEEQQAMQQQQVLQQQMQQLELQKLQAEVQKLQSASQLDQAKAQDTLTDSDDKELEVLKLQTEIAAKQAELETKLKIAGIQASIALQKPESSGGPQAQTGRYNQQRSAAAPGGRNN